MRSGLNVRQTEELVRHLMGQQEPRPARPKQQPETEALATRLMDRLGTKVSLKRGRKGGTITLHFYSDEELNAIAETILGTGEEEGTA
jgi:ParB family chromosome partitioning protein